MRGSPANSARSRQWRVVGLVDDDPAKHGRQLRDHKVLGTIASLPQWAERYGVRKVIIALPSAEHGVRRRAPRSAPPPGWKR